jgi:osmotically-inducible protein OsmY
MCKLLALPLVGVLAVGAYNLSTGNNLLHIPGARTIASTVRETVGDTVRDGVRSAARETGAEVRERASTGVQVVVNRTEGAMTAAALTSKIKAKMALDDVVNANEIDVDTEGSVVTLTGDVGSRGEQQRAVRIATETKGVTKVVNQLRVR